MMLTLTIVLFALMVMFIFILYLAYVVYRQQLKPLHYDVYLEYIDTDKLGPYYVSLANKLGKKFDVYDNNNGPMMLREDGLWHYLAMAHTHQALANYEVYINTGRRSYLDTFM